VRAQFRFADHSSGTDPMRYANGQRVHMVSLTSCLFYGHVSNSVGHESTVDYVPRVGTRNSEHSTGYRNSNFWEILIICIDLDGTLKLTRLDLLWIQRDIDAIGRTIAMWRVFSYFKGFQV